MNIAEVQQTLAFAAMCVDATAKAEGCSRREMYQRLRKVGLMHGLTTRLDPLHTQSMEYVVEDLLDKCLRFIKAEPLNDLARKEDDYA